MIQAGRWGKERHSGRICDQNPKKIKRVEVREKKEGARCLTGEGEGGFGVISTGKTASVILSSLKQHYSLFWGLTAII